MSAAPRVRLLAAFAAAAALAACGGGGSPGSAAPTPPPASADGATLSVTLGGGASPGVDHLWVTVSGLALHADPDKVYGDGDPGWVVLPLPTPVTVDLAAPGLSQGQSIALLKTPVRQLGTYGQLRLLVLPADTGSLARSAQDAGLAWNDQVQVTDGAGTRLAPLELATLTGLRTTTAFTLSADTTTPVGIEWGAHASLLRRASSSGGADRFMLRDELALYNQQLLTALGGDTLQIQGNLFDAIAGRLATAQFCTGAATAGCIHDVVASATSLSADGRFHRPVRSVNVGADGSFVLYPLPTDTIYDVVIHGANMRTMVVRNVFVDPTGLLEPFPSSLGSTATPMVPVLDTGGTTLAVPAALAPSASRVVVGFTLPGSGTAAGGGDLPYVLDFAAADPATGRVRDPIALPGGPVLDAVLPTGAPSLGTVPAFTPVTPAEGLGGFTAWTEGTLADAASDTLVLAPGTASLVAPAPKRRAGFIDGTLQVTLAGASSSGADRAELVVANDGGPVAIVDATAQMGSHAPIAVTLPAGRAAAAPGAAVYGLALRTWKSADEVGSARWTRLAAPVSLQDSAAATATLSLP